MHFVCWRVKRIDIFYLLRYFGLPTILRKSLTGGRCPDTTRLLSVYLRNAVWIISGIPVWMWRNTQPGVDLFREQADLLVDMGGTEPRSVRIHSCEIITIAINQPRFRIFSKISETKNMSAFWENAGDVFLRQHSGRSAKQNGTSCPMGGRIAPLFVLVDSENGYLFSESRVSKGAPFGTQPCLQGVVCYTCWHGWRVKRGCDVATHSFFAAGKRTVFCKWKWAKILFAFGSSGRYTAPVFRPFSFR